MIVTLRVTRENKGTFAIMLFAEHVIDVVELNKLSGNLKLICKMFVQTSVVIEQAFEVTEFALLERGIKEFVSYIIRLTSGLESTDTQAI
jgi:hypothetical protein